MSHHHFEQFTFFNRKRLRETNENHSPGKKLLDFQRTFNEKTFLHN
jgi:hypothetical protein